MLSQVKTPDEHIEYGRALVASGGIKALRLRLGFTQSSMAALIPMSPITYSHFERDAASGPDPWGPSTRTLERLGRFAWLAGLVLEELSQYGVSITDLTPLHVVASTYGIPQEVLLKWYREGVIHGDDLGILGLWIHGDDLPLIKEAMA